MQSINCKGKLLTICNPIVMGIINATPDSFYKGFLNCSKDEILAIAEKQVAEGASIIDIGGQSTKPSSIAISASEEMDRVLPIIIHLHKYLPQTIFSVDTYYSEVAKAAVEAGASMVNDVSTGNLDEQMMHTVAALKVPYICMHMLGTPTNMQQNPMYKNVVSDVLDFFVGKINDCKNAGIMDILIDPGFGFGKTIDHNFELLGNLSTLKILDKPILVGISRKRMVYETIGTTASEALNGTTSLHTIALLNGANILRVHDVKEAKQTIDLFVKYKQ